MPVKGKSKRKPSTYGLYPKNYPKPIRWKIDQEYASKLSTEDRAWLARFNDAYYGNNFRDATDAEWSTAQKREAYRQNHTARRDTYECAGVEFTEDMIWEPQATVDTDWADTPTYLDKPEYQAALKAYRAAAEGDRKAPEFYRAKRALEALVEEREDDGQE